MLTGKAIAKSTTRSVAEVRTVLEDGINKCDVTVR